jgi:putative phosphoribosyl transferase
MLFRDRFDAGRQLAALLAPYANAPKLLVLALPRGGVEVAFPVAVALHAPLRLCIVRKLGVPGHPEFAMGAIASGGIRVLSEQVISRLGISDSAVQATIAREEQELARREALYQGTAGLPQIEGQTVILIDDGIATGSTMRVAAAAVRQKGPKRLVIAAPVAAPSTLARLAPEADEIVCVSRPEDLEAISQFYEDFRQVSDEEVRELLERAARDSNGHDSTIQHVA